MSNAPPDQPTTKKKMSGCMLAVIIVGTLMLLGAIGVAVMVVLALRSPEGAAVVDIMKTSVQAQSGPGADALRAQGCKSIGVLPVAALNQIAARADAGPVIPDTATLLITCFDPPATRSCDELAAAYAAQEQLAGHIRFAVVANQQDRCAGYYDPRGRPISLPVEAPTP